MPALRHLLITMVVQPRWTILYSVAGALLGLWSRWRVRRLKLSNLSSPWLRPPVENWVLKLCIVVNSVCRWGLVVSWLVLVLLLS